MTYGSGIVECVMNAVAAAEDLYFRGWRALESSDGRIPFLARLNQGGELLRAFRFHLAEEGPNEINWQRVGSSHLAFTNADRALGDRATIVALIELTKRHEEDVRLLLEARDDI